MPDNKQEVIADLRAMIRASDRTQGSIASDAGISQPALSQWMRGKSQLSNETLERLASAVGLQFSVTYSLTDAPKGNGIDLKA